MDDDDMKPYRVSPYSFLHFKSTLCLFLNTPYTLSLNFGIGAFSSGRGTGFIIGPCNNLFASGDDGGTSRETGGTEECGLDAEMSRVERCFHLDNLGATLEIVSVEALAARTGGAGTGVGNGAGLVGAGDGDVRGVVGLAGIAGGGDVGGRDVGDRDVGVEMTMLEGKMMVNQRDEAEWATLVMAILGNRARSMCQG
ncbi:hypothetical protein BJ165DRAFT_1409502 [Panaeolus papilionaceus]|nr:hypothetical protein BJ165DRAFT_1409502 [Panaeolus papilionaceus]